MEEFEAELQGHMKECNQSNQESAARKKGKNTHDASRETTQPRRRAGSAGAGAKAGAGAGASGKVGAATASTNSEKERTRLWKVLRERKKRR
jgi:hypothetical protein